MGLQELTQKITQRLEQWQKAQKNQTSGYQYEKSFTELWQQLGQEVFQSSLGEASYDKNYKKKSGQAGERPPWRFNAINPRGKMEGVVPPGLS